MRAIAVARWPVWLAALVLLAGLIVIDPALSQAFRAMAAPIAGELFVVTQLGLSDWVLMPSGLVAVASGLAGLALGGGRRRTFVRQVAALSGLLFVGTGLPGLVASVLKQAIGRPRPMLFDSAGALGFRPLVGDWTFQSFPSGHTASIFALAAIRGLRWPALSLPALGIAAAVGLSRIGLGLHYPSDVLAGALLGLFGAMVIARMFAARGWVFKRGPGGSLTVRPIAWPAGLIRVRPRGSVPAPLRNRP